MTNRFPPPPERLPFLSNLLVATAVKTETPPKSSLLKKALVATLVVAVPGGTLLGLAYLIAKKRKAKTADTEAPKAP